GVQNAFFVLLRAVVVVMLTIIVGRFAWAGSYNLLDRLFADPAKSRFPTLLTRARHYSPAIGFLLRAVIVITALVFILQGWGLDAMFWLHHNPVSQALIRAFSSVLITALVAFSLWEIYNYALHARVEKLSGTGRRRQATRLRTLAPILRAGVGTFIFAVAFVVCLSDIGVNTTGLLAVSSIAGIAVGFGSQRLVQDVITGMFLLLEDAVQVGDSVTLGGISGTVERLSVRTIRLRGSDGSINIIPFSSVTIVTNATRDFSNAELSITVSYSADIDRVCAVLSDIGKTMRTEAAWGAMMRDDLQIFGLDKFGDQGIVISAQIRTGPGQNFAVRREFYRRVQQRFKAEGIVIPLGQQRVFKLEMAQPPPQETKES
ncbi:MAG TPA: mechanosensitive ion channel domain-containing protein, partial [Acidocella sp.]|nr:mechanosensitive ion channel domain-containing protein [Acidocella sp.]